jgi:predicted O-linked N-acetylglucosamine transferase (SPINDLY family)
MFDWLKKRKESPQSAVAALAAGAQPASRRDDELTLETLKKEGDQFLKLGQFKEAEDCYLRVLQADPDYAFALINLGFVLQEQGRADEALAYLRRALQIAPDDADTHYLLATLLRSRGRQDEALVHLERAVSLRTDFENAYRELVSMLFDSGQFDRAALWSDTAIRLAAGSPDILLYRSFLHAQAGQLEAAIATCRRALTMRAGATAAGHLGRLLHALLQRIEASPPGASGGLASATIDGQVLAEGLEPRARAGTLEGARSPLEREIAQAYFDLGAAYRAAFDFALAQSAFERAIALAPEVAGFHYALGSTLQLRQSLDAAMQCFERAIALEPDDLLARWAKAMLNVSAFPASRLRALQERELLAQSITEFERWWEDTDIRGDEFVGAHAPFFLSYQECDNRSVLLLHGALCCRAMQRWLVSQGRFERTARVSRRLRVGIVSADIREHSVWFALIKGWLRHLDRERLEIGLFSLSGILDHEYEWARSQADYMIEGPRPLDQWVSAIRERDPEVLIYPAIGLDPFTWQLASLRLAPTQVNTWGHPDTCGLPTIDFYLSGAEFEGDDAKEYYTEKLVRLPGLGNAYEMRATQPAVLDWADLGIDPNRPILICPGNAFKYQPEFDTVFAGIARCIPDCQLVFFRQRPTDLADQLRDRLVRVFSEADLDFAHCGRFIANQPIDRYHELLRSAHVFLDSIGFSGYNNVVQAVECSLPVVTREGRFLRGRLGSGVLRRMGLTELIVPTEEAYVALAARLISDVDYSRKIRSDLAERRHVLYNDTRAVRALEDFLIAVRAPADPGGAQPI